MELAVMPTENAIAATAKQLAIDATRRPTEALPDSARRMQHRKGDEAEHLSLVQGKKQGSSEICVQEAFDRLAAEAARGRSPRIPRPSETKRNLFPWCREKSREV
jgi:hypothetical protein